jgi:hypothetical protein
MKKCFVFTLTFCLLVNSRGLSAGPPQSVQTGLAGTWTLVSMQQHSDSRAPATVAARGLLVFDGAGHTLEVVIRSNTQPLPGLSEGRSRLSLGGSWGTYRADTTSKKITYRPAGAVSPNLMGREFSRSFDLTGDRLTVTSLSGELHMNGVTQWVWERVPMVTNFGEGYREVVGFWQHVSERRVSTATGAVLSETKRAPSVIVYTPSGYVGVHFPIADRKPFASGEPTDAEESVLSNYLGYYAALGVYPGMVFHQVLGTVSIGNPAGGVATGNTLKRFYALKGNELQITFPPTTNQDGQQQTTIVVLKRLSGEKEMLAR